MATTYISTSTSLSEQHPPFTFTSPVSSETHHEDAALDFDYESWVQQSKMANYYSNIWSDDIEAQAIGRHHREMMLKAVDNLPEEAYELSLRDLSELSLSGRATTTGGSAPNCSSVTLGTTVRSPSSTKPWRKKTTPSMEGAGFIIRLFMPPPSRAAGGGGRKKSKNLSFSNSTVPSLRENAALVGTGNDSSCTRSHSMPRKSHQHATNKYLSLSADTPNFKNAKVNLAAVTFMEIQQFGFVIPFFHSFLMKVNKLAGNRWAAIHSSIPASTRWNRKMVVACASRKHETAGGWDQSLGRRVVCACA